PAGPLGFAWVARAALPFEADLRKHLGAAPRRYFDELGRSLAAPRPPAPAPAPRGWRARPAAALRSPAQPSAPPPPAADRVLAYLGARVAPPAPEPGAVPRRGDVSFRDRVCALFNGDPYRWRRGGVLRALGAAAVVLAVALGLHLAWAGRATVDD